MRTAVAVAIVVVVGRKHVQQHRNQVEERESEHKTINKQKASEFALISPPPLSVPSITLLLRRFYAINRNPIGFVNETTTYTLTTLPFTSRLRYETKPFLH